jgi:hypothetical protein
MLAAVSESIRDLLAAIAALTAPSPAGAAASSIAVIAKACGTRSFGRSKLQKRNISSHSIRTS